MNYYVYIIFSELLGKYYCGSTENFARRLQEHNSGKGKFTSKGVPWTEKMIFENASRPEATRLEIKIKKRGIKRYLDDLQNKPSGGGAAR